jgi:hypothetical protein
MLVSMAMNVLAVLFFKRDLCMYVCYTPPSKQKYTYICFALSPNTRPSYSI